MLNKSSHTVCSNNKSPLTGAGGWTVQPQSDLSKPRWSTFECFAQRHLSGRRQRSKLCSYFLPHLNFILLNWRDSRLLLLQSGPETPRSMLDECTWVIKGTVAQSKSFVSCSFWRWNWIDGVMMIEKRRDDCTSLGVLKDGGGGLRDGDVSVR